jgi:hypothetical protein
MRGRAQHRGNPWAETTRHSEIMARKTRPKSSRPRPRRHRETSGKGSVVAYQRTVFLVLSAIVILATVAEVLFREIDLVDRFAPNIATESLGILLVLIFVQRYLERQERSQRLRGSIGGLRKASRALQRLIDTWATLVKGTLPRTPEPLPKVTGDLLEPHYAEELAHIDARCMRGLPGEGEAWVRWASRELTEATSLLNQIIIAYSGALDPAYVEAIDELVDDPFAGFFAELVAEGADSRTWRVRMNAGRALREVHFSRLAATISLHNDLARDAAAVRTRRMAPRTGTIGMELPLDHDLRVHVDLERRWWNGTPLIGVLREDRDVG